MRKIGRRKGERKATSVYCIIDCILFLHYHFCGIISQKRSHKNCKIYLLHLFIKRSSVRAQNLGCSDLMNAKTSFCSSIWSLSVFVQYKISFLNILIVF
jgi:hypothetical protein